MTDEKKWWEKIENVVTLSRWMAQNEYFANPQEVVDFFEKPYHYDDEWKEYQAEDRTEKWKATGE